MHFSHNGKVIGTLKENVFRKKVKKSKHLMRMNDSWGIQYEALKQLHDEGCEEIRILEQEENIIYSVPFETIWKKGVMMNQGHGDQVFLPRSEWEMTDYTP